MRCGKAGWLAKSWGCATWSEVGCMAEMSCVCVVCVARKAVVRFIAF